jgi:superfamily II DNA/RNA helicase, SNF2 family
MSSQLTQAPAPGARVLIRDEEWLVQRADASEHGGWQLACVGVSETVRNRQALFLSVLDEVTLIDPARTELVFDISPGFIEGRLAIEARLRQSAVQGEALVMGQHGVMDTMPFQLEPTRRALQSLRPRLLIADTVGLGKTLEAGILTAELMRRGRARRILVVTTKSMMRQFQQEFWNRFTIALTRLDSAGIQRIRRDIPANHNPFSHFDRTIISVDTLKRDSEYRHYLENAWWDLIIIDEAHNVSYKGNRTQSNRLADLLSRRSDALILLTATPHNGRKDSFASLMRMLDPTALPKNVRDYTRADVEHLFIRRFKQDVRKQIKQAFPERQVYKLPAHATPAENAAFDCLSHLELASDAARRDGALLFRTVLEKALFSSPAACLQTLRERIGRLEKRDAAHPDLTALRELQQRVQAIDPAQFSKLQRLVALLKGTAKASCAAAHAIAPEPTLTSATATGTGTGTGAASAADAAGGAFRASVICTTPPAASHLPQWCWTGTDPADRLVLFTERIETLHFLHQHLPAMLGLKGEAVAILHGQLPDQEIQQTVENFGRTHSPLRLLIASDVASEGLNLHYQAHRLIHFDIPWSLMVFQQRNGRVDRYGQTRTPMIGYLYTQPDDERIRGDLRYLEILVEKDEQAAHNIGDPSVFMGLYDEEAEAQKVAGAIEGQQTAEAFSAELDANAVQDITDPFAELFGHGGDGGSSDHGASSDDGGHATDTGHETGAHGDTAGNDTATQTLPTLFRTHFHYLRDGLRWLYNPRPVVRHDGVRRYDGSVRYDGGGAQGSTSMRVEEDDATQTLSFQPDRELSLLLSRELAPEMWPDDNHFTLSASAEAVNGAISHARNDDHWPRVQYAWPLHPVAQWLDYKLLASFGRQRAPLIRVPAGVPSSAGMAQPSPAASGSGAGRSGALAAGAPAAAATAPLQSGEALIIVLAQLPNRRGQTMLSDWMAIRLNALGQVQRPVLGLPEALQLAGLDAAACRDIPNDGRAPDAGVITRLQAALPAVLGAAQAHLRPHKQQLDQHNRTRLQAELDKLRTLQGKHAAQLELELQHGIEQVNAAKRQREEAATERLFDEYTQWARDTLNLDDRAQYTVVAAVLAQ